MNADPIIEKFLADICTAFPEIRPRMECHDDYMTEYNKIQASAEATTEAFERGAKETGVAYLTFMSKRLNINNPKEYEFIDVCYVENLFWPHGTEAARAGWPLMPKNLKALFLEFHQKPPL